MFKFGKKKGKVSAIDGDLRSTQPSEVRGKEVSNSKPTEKKNIKILAVCGSGVVMSHQIANTIADMFNDLGYIVDADTCNPTELDGMLSRAKYDFIANASPIGDTHGVPAISAMGIITGLNAEEFTKKALEILHAEGK